MRSTLRRAAVSLATASLLATPFVVFADEEGVVEATSADVGASTQAVNGATVETTTTVTETGTLIEIGNTTAEETTVVVRTSEPDGTTTDQTLQIETAATTLTTDGGTPADLSDWVAGDQLTFTATESTNSEELKARSVRNRSFKRGHVGRNGFVKAIRADEHELDVEWAGKVYTLNTAAAKMVAGGKNPASLTDFQVGDRVRARVKDDGDGNNLTWDATIVVVLRRGGALFMRVTRWVVPARITALPADTSTFPYTITVEVLPSRFYQAGDVNNLVGAPGTSLQVDVTDATKLRRRFLGKALIGEMSEGDEVRIIGRRDESTGHLVAGIIKNNSIQRLGVAQHLGRVQTVDAAATTLTVTPYLAPRGRTWTVQASPTTKVVKNGQAVSFDTIVVGDVVRLRGTANRNTGTITTVTGIAIVTDRLAPR
jgi:hypothetical protein